MRWAPPVFVRILMAVVIGLFLSKSFLGKAHLELLISAGMTFFALSFFTHLSKKVKYYRLSGLFALLSIVIFSSLLFQVNKTEGQLSDSLRGKEVIIKSTVVELGKPYSGGMIFDAKVEMIGDGIECMSPEDCKVRVYIRGATERNWLGRSMMFSVPWNGLSQVLNTYQFDYSEFLLSRNIIGQCFVDSSSVTLSRARMDFIEQGQVLLNSWRWYGIQRLRDSKVMREETMNVLSALCLGDRASVDEETETRFVNAGIIHILAVSGLHVGIIYLAIGFLLSKLLPSDNMAWLRIILVLTGLWLYAGITGFSPSVLRASVMFSFIVIGREYKRKANIFNSIAASAFVLLLLDPALIFSVGFQLSYSAVIGIVAFYPKLNSLLTPKNRLLNYFWNLLCVTLVAQLATLPFSLFYFHQFPTFFWITNLLVLPLIPVLLSGGLLYIGLSFLPLMSSLIAYPLEFLSQILLGSVKFVGNIPLSVVKPIFISHWQFIILLTAVFFILLYSQTAKRRNVLIALGLFSVVPIFSLFNRMSSSKEKEVVYYASSSYHRHTSFRIGERVLVVGDTANSFSWKNHQLSNYCKSSISIPHSTDTIIRELEFEKRGNVVYFGNRFYALSEEAGNSFWYQVVSGKISSSSAVAHIYARRNEQYIIIF